MLPIVVSAIQSLHVLDQSQRIIYSALILCRQAHENYERVV